MSITGPDPHQPMPRHISSLCPVCGTAEYSIFARVPTPYLDHAERYEIITCSGCGHGRADGRRDAGYLASIYAGSFFSSSQQSIANPMAPINVNARRRANELGRIAAGRLLDVGAGNGAFLAAASANFLVEGVELSPEAASSARRMGFTVHVGDFLALPLTPASYDVVTMWDVLASLNDPMAALERCHSLLCSGGRLVVTLPMIDSLAARLTRSAWPLLIPPVNLHYFTQVGIKRLASAASFDVEMLNYNSKLVSLRFVAQKAARSLKLFKTGESLASLVPAIAIPLNTGDIATVILRKRAEPAK